MFRFDMDYVTTDYYRKSVIPYLMEPDYYVPGNIIYSDHYGIRTTNGTTTQTIAGNESSPGYREGIGENAKFNSVEGFHQLSHTQIVVSDSWNDCLRLIDRQSRQTSVYAGPCKSSASRFRGPVSVISDVKKSDSLHVLDKNAVFSVNTQSRGVSIFCVNFENG